MTLEVSSHVTCLHGGEGRANLSNGVRLSDWALIPHFDPAAHGTFLIVWLFTGHMHATHLLAP
jgi:hypothetical protein